MKAKKARAASRNNSSLLADFARSLGSTLGAVAAKTEELSKPAQKRRTSRKPATRAQSKQKRSKA
jgi:hypothetical protein